MKFLLTALLCIMSVTLISYTSALTTTKTEIVKHTDSDPEKEGFWARKESWKSRWVKYWRPKTIYVPVWKKVWTPVIQNEWVPLPNSPVGWSKHDKSSVSEIVY